jgi:tetratricopeptide (TPR) repeat protein
MSYSDEQLWTMLDQAYQMPYGPGQIALVEQIIAHADAQHLIPLAFAARMQATSSYVYGGEPVRSFATFAWCLAEFDRDPAAYERQYRTLLWHFKYMAGALTRFPEVPLARAYGVLDDMQRRWQETGHSLQAVYAYRHHVAAHIGDMDAAEAYYEQWCAAPRDDLSDCVGCDPTQKAGWLSQRRRYEQAVALGDPVLSGQLTCSEQPQNMLTTLMVPYVRTGRLDQARDAHRRAYRLHRPHLADLNNIADHIEFCARTGNEARAVEIVERHLGWLDRAPSPWAAMLFAAVSSLALRCAQARHDGELTVYRPAHGDREAGRFRASALAEELSTLATELAQRFDDRNSTDRVGRLIRDTLADETWVEHLPLSPTATRPIRPIPGSSTVEELFAKSVPGSVAPQPPPVSVPESSGPDELLDLIEEYHHTDQDERADAALDAFAARYSGSELTPHQQARLTDATAVRVADGQRYDDAARMWREAARDYAAAGDAEREHRALARAAAALCWRGDRDDQLSTLVDVTGWLLDHGSPASRVPDALRLAIVHHNARRSEAALAILDQVTDDLDDAPPSRRARHAVVRLSALAQLHRADEILRTGHAAIELVEAAGTGDDAARAHSTLAAALQQAGNMAGAADHLAAASAVVTDEQIRTGMLRARARLLAQTDRAGEATDELVEQVAEATARGDADDAADARHSLAIAYLNTDRLLDAAEVAEEELAYRLRDDQAAVVNDRLEVRNLLATIYQRLGQPMEAVAQLDAIAEELTTDRVGRARVAQRTAEILDGADRDEEAAARFLVAADICTELDEPLAELYNRRRHAISLRWARRTDEAVGALAKADELASRMTGDDETTRWELARLHYDAARILWAAGRLSAAARRAAGAAEASLTLDSAGSAAESRLMQARILLEAGEAAQAEAAIQQALAVLPDDADRQPYEEVLHDARHALGRSDGSEESR